MALKTFDRETMLDLVVNAIPLGIILFFIVVFAVLNPFGPNLVHTALQFSIVGLTFVALTILTYYSAKAISEAEEEMQEKGIDVGPGGTEPSEHAEPDIEE